MDRGRDTPSLLGDHLRRARHEGGWRQVEVAASAGVSQATISRMELGRGGSITLATWAAVAAATGHRFTADLVSELPAGEDASDPTTASADSAVRQCHGLITDMAREGGWTAVTEISAEAIETVLVRPQRGEVAILRVWDAIAGIDPAADDFVQAIDREYEIRADPVTVSGLAVVLRTPGNRRRVAEGTATLREVLPGSGASWLGAIRSVRVAMPREPGLLWAAPDGSRIRPTAHRPGWR
jgi:transcriptional regulator with XRE-family HTH domain